MGLCLPRATLKNWMKGDEAATQWCAQLLDVLAVWDDLIDDDQDASPQDINAAFTAALVNMPMNPFYRRSQDVLHPVMLAALRNWTLANEMERAGVTPQVSFVIRSTYIDALATCAALLGGYDWSVDVAREARQFFHSEGFELYQLDLQEEQRLRDVRRR